MDNYQTAEPSAKLSNLHLLGPEHKTLPANEMMAFTKRKHL